ncbi:MAG: sensor histidine kinase [Clostridia bacterium]|nr:sensor histidine kinase [Clostridia bacterium]
MMSIYTNEMIAVYFFYGLAFFAMALAIAFQVRMNSSFILAKPLWLLVGFGLFQAFAEWAKVTKLLNMYGINLLDITVLHLADVLTIGLSFLFLFLFGSHLVIASLDKYNFLKYLPFIVALGWIAKFVIVDFILFPLENFKVWTANSTAWARYLMAFPGALLASWGLILQLPELKRLGLKSAYYNCQGAAFAFAAYGFFSGLITFPVGFWPGNVLNTTVFLKATGLPVQFFRASFGLMMAFTVIKTINIFNVEQQKRLEEAERISVLMEERERFSRDLHDGIIQSIYGAGLIIDASQAMLKKEQYDQVHEHMLEAKEKLNKTIAELRDYIRDLQEAKGTKGNLKHILLQLLSEFRKFSMIPIDFEDRLSKELFLNPKQETSIYHIIQEALFNVVKHAQATKARLVVEENENHELMIRIVDNGVGFNYKQWQERGSVEKKGLANMKFRAQRLGGKLTVNTNPGQGTQIIFSLKLQDKE